MQMKIGDMHLEIQKSFYNKSHVQEDGVTHVIDTEHSYPYYQFGMVKNYFDIDDKRDLLQGLIADLKEVTAELERQLEQEQSQNKEREGR